MTATDGRELLDAAQAKIDAAKRRDAAERKTRRQLDRPVRPHLQAVIGAPPTPQRVGESKRRRRRGRDRADGDEWIDPGPVGRDDVDPDDVYGAPIPEGEYVVVFESQARRLKMFKNASDKWLCTMRVIEGEHAGRALLFACPVPPQKGRPRPSYKLSKLWAAIAPDWRLPRDLARRSPGNLLSGCTLLAKIETVRKDAAGEGRPGNLTYSIVRDVVKRLDGTPPALETEPTP